MVGLQKVKDKFNQLIALAETDAEKRQRGLTVPQRTMHLVFEGEPGTGKSTAADILAQAYYGVGLVDNPKPVKIRGRELVAGFSGQTDERVREVFEAAKGGVLFVDEFYSIVNSEQDDFGKEALNAFNDLVEQHRNDTVVILAGYEGDQGGLKYLNRFNPGIESRFPTRVQFEGYSPKELGQIAMRRIESDAKPYNRAARQALLSAAGKVQGNGRGVRNLVDEIHRQSALRAQRVKRSGRSLTNRDLESYTARDVKAAARELGLR